MEYDFTNLSKEYNKFLIGLFPVKYTKKRPQAMFDCYAINKEIKIETKLNRKHKKHILQSLRTKSDIWKKEDEWRILLVNEHRNTINLSIISKIYLGANMKQEDKETLIKIAKNKSIEYQEMKIHNKEYAFL